MKNPILTLVSLIALQLSYSQQTNPINTGVPFLQVAADARSAAMGDQGVATSADVFSAQYNPAKFAFSEFKQGVSLSYTPYLTDLVNDISLAQVTYYNRINDRSAFSGGFRYFGLGDIEFRENANDLGQIVSPNEFALEASYSLKLSEKFSMGVGGRFINSNLRFQDAANDAKPARTFAVDIAGFYQSEEMAFNNFNGRLRGGINIQNLGPKINYDSNELNPSNLPTNLKFGSGFDFIFDEFNKLSVNLEFNKLLVPTPKNLDPNATDIERTKARNDYSKIGWVSGVFQSFGDAPGGISEEFKEFTYAIGSEYLYQDSFAFRAGYFHESPAKGARQFLSLGAGFKYQNVKIDVSYLFSTSKIKSPLENTLRFSLSFNFGDKYNDL